MKTGEIPVAREMNGLSMTEGRCHETEQPVTALESAQHRRTGAFLAGR